MWDPYWPWFLTAVTATSPLGFLPASRQSVLGGAGNSRRSADSAALDGCGGTESRW